jgi:hypothetical protein
MDSRHLASEKPPATSGAVAGIKPVTTGDQIELDHAIGYSGKVVNSVFLHPNTKDFVLVAGCSVVVGDLSDPHN